MRYKKVLKIELEVESGYFKGGKKGKVTDNCRNGYSEKTVKTYSLKRCINCLASRILGTFLKL